VKVLRYKRRSKAGAAIACAVIELLDECFRLDADRR
jgi:hypothetical protein